MKKLCYIAVALLAFIAPATAQVNPGTSPLSIAKGGTAANTRAGAAMNILPAFTGDVTSSLGGFVLTLAIVNSNVGSFGSATQCVSFTTNAKGLITAAAVVTCTPGIAAVTGLGTNVATVLGAAANGSGGVVAPTPTRAGDVVYWNGTTWVTLAGNNSGTNVLQETSAGVPSWVAASGGGTMLSLTPGGGLVSSVTAACSQTAVTTSGTFSAAHCINAQSGTSYAIQDSDRAKTIIANNAAAQAYAIAQAGAASAFQSGWYTDIQNSSVNAAAIVTITASTSQLCAQGTCAPTYKILPGQFARISSDGTNYQVTMNPALKAQTRQVFLSGTGATYTTPTPAPLYDVIRMQGGGAGGGGSGTGGGAGTVGNASSVVVSSTTITAGGGGAGSAGGGSASGGTNTNCTTGIVAAVTSAVGYSGGASGAASGGTNIPGGAGGSTSTGAGGGGGSTSPGAGGPGATNSGGGGGGAGDGSVGPSGSGGAGGAYCELVISPVPATMTYTVGATAAAGSAGTSGAAGGVGAAGDIIFEEHYQ